jgi:hypothetical protein
VEKVWWRLKQEVAANYLWPSLEALQDAIHGFFAGFSPDEALQLVHRRNGRLPDDLASAPPLSLAA